MFVDIICQNHERRLCCESGKVLDISYANYGRSVAYARCGLSFKKECLTPASLQIVREVCQNKISCTLNASDDVFGNHCSNAGKYLRILYECVPHETLWNLVNISLMAVCCFILLFVAVALGIFITRRNNRSARDRQTDTRDKSQEIGEAGEDTAYERYEKTAGVSLKRHTAEDLSQLQGEGAYTLYGDNKVETSHRRPADIPEEQRGDGAYTLYGDTETVSNEPQRHSYANKKMLLYETIADGETSHHTESGGIPQQNRMQQGTSMKSSVYESV